MWEEEGRKGDMKGRLTNDRLRHHPNRGPQPVSLGHLRLDLDLAVLDALLALGVDTGGADGVDYAAYNGGGC